MKFILKNLGTKIWFITTSIVLVLILVLNILVTNVDLFSNTMDFMFGAPERYLVSGDPSEYQYFEGSYDKTDVTKKDVKAAGNEFNLNVAREGFTLLKNDNKALPMNSDSKVTVFGKNSVNLVYGGSGSAGSSSDSTVTLYESLTNAGFDVNPTMKAFYSSDDSGSGRPENPGMGITIPGFATGETPQSMYTSKQTDSYSSYSDAAIIVISRIGGEGFDLPRTMGEKYNSKTGEVEGTVEGAFSNTDHYLQLDKNETEMIEAVKASNKFERVIVLVNCTQTFELGTLQDDANIDSILWVPASGATGITAVGEILSGKVNPSGKTIDTFSRDFKAEPSWQNFGNNNNYYGNRYTVDGKKYSNYYVKYEEGIYVGYRYWETRGFTDGEDWYNDYVVYPFAHGLSYTTFTQTIKSTAPEANAVITDETEIKVTVTVTNTGDVAGKDVAEIYYTAPVTENGIEKAHVTLSAYAKTKLLEPGESQDLELTFSANDMASYDYSDANGNSNKGYELEKGNYIVRLMRNSHEEIANVNYQVANTINIKNDEVTGTEVVNRFDDVSNHEEGVTKSLSRFDWEGTFPTAPTADERDVTKAFLASLDFDLDAAIANWDVEEAPKYAKSAASERNTDVKLHMLIGKDYDDPLWDEMLDQLTLKEMADLIGTACYSTAYLQRIGLPATKDNDGPVGFTKFMGKDPSIHDTVYYACGNLLSATYNLELAKGMGESIGEEALVGYAAGDGTPYSGWYAPAANIHRSPFGGRNWEYMSEDPFVSGMVSASIIQGANEYGVYTFMKHFALNDQETNRDTDGLLTWSNEQAIREIYLKPFELGVKVGESKGIMSSFNRIGTTWAGGNYQLLTEVLRNEWGFQGMVITDFNTPTYTYMEPDQMTLAGGSINLAQDIKPECKDITKEQIMALRCSIHDFLYVIANSNAMNGFGDGMVYAYATPGWLKLSWLIEGGVVALLAIWGAVIIVLTKKKEND